MKIFPQPQADGQRRNHQGYTLVEMMFSAGIYMFILVGVVVAIQIFALRVYTLAATKLTATQGSRAAMNQIRDDIRQGKVLYVGNSDNSGNFTAASGTNAAVGNALEIFLSTNQAAPPYSIYYMQTNTIGSTSSNVLLWISVTTTSTVTANLATYVTNMDVFAAEDWDNWPTTTNAMTPTTNSINNQIISVKLQFYQWEYPIAIISSNTAANAYDYYQLRTRVCRRALD